MKNIRFTGLLDDVSFQKFPDNDIHGYQTEEAGKRAEDRIRRIVGQTFHSKDFSGSRMQFVSFKDCNTKTMIAPDDGKHLLIRDMAAVAQKVYTGIERNWPDENTKSWALCCTGNYLTRTTGIVSFYEFKHFENEEFAGRLMDLFRKYNVCGEN